MHISIFWLLLLLTGNVSNEETVFLGERLQQDGTNRLMLDLSPIVEKRKMTDQEFRSLFSKGGKDPESVEDTAVDVPAKLLQSFFPAALLQQNKRFFVVLNSQLFEATTQQFYVVKSEVAPEWNIQLQLKPEQSTVLPAIQEGDFLIASTQPLSDPLVFSKAEFRDPVALDSLNSYLAKEKFKQEQNLTRLSKKKPLTDEESQLLAEYANFKKENYSQESLFFTNPKVKEYIYISYLCAEGRGFSGLFRYDTAEKRIEPIVPLQFSSYCPSHALDSNIIEVDVDQDSQNEIFFRVIYFEGYDLQGYTRDPKSNRYMQLIATAYSGV